MAEENCPRNFEQEILPHLDAAYNLARWLTRNDQEAGDLVQEACLRAFRFFGGFRGGNARAWLLKIVRNSFYTWLQRNAAQEPTTEFDENFLVPILMHRIQKNLYSKTPAENWSAERSKSSHSIFAKC